MKQNLGYSSSFALTERVSGRLSQEFSLAIMLFQAACLSIQHVRTFFLLLAYGAQQWRTGNEFKSPRLFHHTAVSFSHSLSSVPVFLLASMRFCSTRRSLPFFASFWWAPVCCYSLLAPEREICLRLVQWRPYEPKIERKIVKIPLKTDEIRHYSETRMQKRQKIQIHLGHLAVRRLILIKILALLNYSGLQKTRES